MFDFINTLDTNYYKETKNPDAEYRMMTFVNMHNEGLLVLPTHRLVGNLENFNAADLVQKLSADFDIAEFSIDQKDAMSTLCLALRCRRAT